MRRSTTDQLHSRPRKVAVVPFKELSRGERVGVRCLRVVHFLLARSGLFLAMFFFMLLSERAEHGEKEPPIRPWIIYTHAALYLATSTGMSSRLAPSMCVYVAAAAYLHMAYLFVSTSATPRLGYAPWLRSRAALHLSALAGASLRMTAAGGDVVGGSFVGRWRHLLACGISGCVCALLGVISMPAEVSHVVDASCHRHELDSAFPAVFVSNFIHWIIGGAFFLAFLAYTFPILASPPAGAWTLTLLCKDLNRVYWQEQAVHDWLQNSLILQDVLIVASLVVGASLPWLGRVTSVEACPKPSPRSDSKKDA